MTPLPKDWMDTYYEYGIDKTNRRIFLDGDIDEKSASCVRKGLLYLDSLDKSKPIELWISTSGGCEYAMFGIYDSIQIIQAPVHTVATGLCMSAGPIIAAAGTFGERYATPNTWFMIHQSWDDWAQSRVDEQRKLMKHCDRLHEEWANIMASRSKLPASKWKKICAEVGDFYFSAEQALEFGIIDHIWAEKS